MDTITPARPSVELRCRVCARRIRKPTRGVPRSDLVRCVDCADAALLRAYGIDPAAARAAYEREQRRRRRCARCDGRLDPGDEAPGSSGEVVCATCRASDVEQRGAPDADEGRRRPVAVVLDAEAALRRACAYAALFLIGIAGFTHTLLGVNLVASALVGATAAWLGGRMIYAAPTATR